MRRIAPEEYPELLERAVQALEGMMDVVHDYLPSQAQRCLRFQEGGSNRNYTARDCENTGSELCEICAARDVLAKVEVL